ncbi:MAG TPA: glycosyltransferase family 4 protein, partial [Egibacteraceae bacterium]|nr:glycosyltransferase family 4 protein [Egibacteraceae bacterium]
MRVCHVTYEYPPHIYGGLGRHVAELTSSLHTAGAEVAVATVAHPRQRRRSRHDGIDVYRVNGVPVIGDGTPWRDAVRAFDDGLSPVLDEAATTADVIHAHDWFAQRTVLDHCRRRGTPLVVTVHATERGRHQGWLPDALNREIDAAERQLASAADRVVVCSDWMAEHVVQIWELEPSRVRVVPNGVTPAAWPEARGGTPEYRVPVVLFAGRLEHEKGGQVLIDALAALKVRGTAAPAAFAGDGSQRVAWHEHAKTVGVVV